MKPLRFLAFGLLALSMISVLAGQDATLKTGATKIQVDVLVRTSDGRVTGVRPEDLIIREQGQIKPIVSFVSEPLPLDLVVLLNCSGKMQSQFDEAMKDVLSALSQLNPPDRIAVISFPDKPNHSKLEQPFTSDAVAIDKAVKRVKSRGSCAGIQGDQGGAIRSAAELLRSEAPARSGAAPRRHAVLMFTENVSMPKSSNELTIRSLSNADAILGAVITLGGLSPTDKSFGIDDLYSIAEATGGDVIPYRKGGLAELVTRLRERNSLWFEAEKTPKDQFRPIAIELSNDVLRRFPGAKVVARKGYYGQ